MGRPARPSAAPGAVRPGGGPLGPVQRRFPGAPCRGSFPRAAVPAPPIGSAGQLEERAKPVGEPFLVRAGYRSSVTFLRRSFSIGSYLLRAVHVLRGFFVF